MNNNVQMEDMCLTELAANEYATIDGGHWYCEAAAAVGDFFEGVADGFRAGVNSWGNFY